MGNSPLIHTIGSYSLFTCIMWGYDGLASSVSLRFNFPTPLSNVLRSFSQSPNSDKTMVPRSMANSSFPQSGNSVSEAQVSSAFSSVVLVQATSPSAGAANSACSYPTVHLLSPFSSPLSIITKVTKSSIHHNRRLPPILLFSPLIHLPWKPPNALRRQSPNRHPPRGLHNHRSNILF